MSLNTNGCGDTNLGDTSEILTKIRECRPPGGFHKGTKFVNDFQLTGFVVV